MRNAILALTLSLVAASSQAQFIPQPVFTLPGGGTLGRFLAKADFNRDGKLDILFAPTTPSEQIELAVFPGDGTGRFGAPIMSAPGGSVETAGDLNGDGLPDVVIRMIDPVTKVVAIGVMLADGTGKFKAPILFDTDIAGQMIVGDFTGDGKADLAVFADTLTVFPGKGNGAFGSPVSSPINLFEATCGVAAADFNRDGKLDLTTGQAVLLGNGDGTFQSPVTVVNGGCGVAVGDFNNDGIPDQVTTGATSGVRIFLGDGTGKFKNSAVYHTGDLAGSLGFAVDRFNGDANLDIAVTNAADNDATMLLGKGDGTFTFGKTFAVSTFDVLSGDFNGDHKIDLAVHSFPGFSVLPGKGDGNFAAPIAQNGQRGSTIQLADFNGDGKLDALEIGSLTTRSVASLGMGNGRFESPVPLPASCQSTSGVVGDFNRDGKLDIAIPGPGGIGICFGRGDGTFKAIEVAGVVEDGTPLGDLQTGDFNHDGKLDLLEEGNGGLSVLLGNGNGTFQSPIVTSVTGILAGFVTGDFNHDGKLDVAANINNQQVSVFLGNGDGTFQSPITTSNPFSFSMVASDVNNDGSLDLVTVARSTAGPYGIRVLLGNGDGTFKTLPFHQFAGVANFMVQDVDGDGKPDLIVDASPFLEVSLGKGDGTFKAATKFIAMKGVASLAAGDLNGDGLVDLVFLEKGQNAQFGTLITYLNQGH
ncbi:MAG TPA: VCBS repeat-containing protein [Candidatus Sulfotelmatobacter sp.]|nr:VCBS repeat-containing protein [Candidatus Sulfotelmatobacter sp.]